MPYLQPNLATRYTSKPVPGVNHPYRVTDGVGKFTRSLDKQSGRLFYFAGHDVEFNGSNDLIPVDADIVDEEDVEC